MTATLGLLLVAPAFAAVGLKPPVLGYSNWNGFHNKINSSLFRDTAKFMKDSGLQAAGYNYITLGGIGYANGSTWPDSQHGWGPDGPGNVRLRSAAAAAARPRLARPLLTRAARAT